MRKIDGLLRGMGIGGWLTNYKRFNVLSKERRMILTIGDMEHFDSYITESDVAYIASLGMDHIRLGFDQLVLEERPFFYRQGIVEILHQFVDWCHKYHLRAVLNLHKAVGNYCDALDEKGLMQSPGLQERFIALWLKLEDEFAADADVAFELLNEVVNATAEEWNSLAERTIHALREKNPDRLIIVGGIEWNNPKGLEKLQVFDDDRVIYTYHCYEPLEFTHQQGVLNADTLFYNRKMPYPCEDVERYREYRRLLYGEEKPYEALERMDIAYLRQYMQPAFDFISRNPDKILWCGEFGTIRHANTVWRENWMRDMIRVLQEYDIPYCVWNYLSTPNDGNRFSLVDDDSRHILSSELAKIIKGDV